MNIGMIYFGSDAARQVGIVYYATSPLDHQMLLFLGPINNNTCEQMSKMFSILEISNGITHVIMLSVLIINPRAPSDVTNQPVG